MFYSSENFSKERYVKEEVTSPSERFIHMKFNVELKQILNGFIIIKWYSDYTYYVDPLALTIVMMKEVHYYKIFALLK